MTRLCYGIFELLDSQSFANCKLVSMNWKAFIDEKFYNLPSGKKWISQKLTSNFLNEDYNPKIEEFILHTEWPVHEIIMDEKNVFVSLDTGVICAYDFKSLELIWRLETCREQHDMFRDGKLTLCMSMDRVFAANVKVVGSRDEGFIYMIGNTNTVLENCINTINSFKSF